MWAGQVCGLRKRAMQEEEGASCQAEGLPPGAARTEMLCGDHPAPPNPAPQPTEANQEVTKHSFSD